MLEAASFFLLPGIEALIVQYVDLSLHWLPCPGYTVREIDFIQ